LALNKNPPYFCHSWLERAYFLMWCWCIVCLEEEVVVFFFASVKQSSWQLVFKGRKKMAFVAKKEC
jgi:hypothetical protein